jgi:hypothetical protein
MEEMHDRNQTRSPELGFDCVYLTPVHPIGELKRKGNLGSPYAVADYRAVDPLYDGREALEAAWGTVLPPQGTAPRRRPRKRLDIAVPSPKLAA